MKQVNEPRKSKILMYIIKAGSWVIPRQFNDLYIRNKNAITIKMAWLLQHYSLVAGQYM